MQNLDVKLTTAGNGYWSNVAKTVRVNGMRLAYINQEGDFGELRVYFDRDTWNVDQDGLIYTDSQWIAQFRAHLRNLGFGAGAVADVTYSEQGMQGNSYVSMDVGTDFIRSYERYTNGIPA